MLSIKMEHSVLPIKLLKLFSFLLDLSWYAAIEINVIFQKKEKKKQLSPNTRVSKAD